MGRWDETRHIKEQKFTKYLIGPGYRSDQVFDLSRMQPLSLLGLLDPLRGLTDSFVLYLPRTSDLRQLAEQSVQGSKTTVIHYCMDGASKVSDSQDVYPTNF